MAIYLLNKCGLCEICKILMSSFCHLLPPHIFIHLLFLLKSWKGVKMVNPISRLPSRRRLWLSSPASEHQPAASNSSSSNYFSSSSSSPSSSNSSSSNYSSSPSSSNCYASSSCLCCYCCWVPTRPQPRTLLAPLSRLGQALLLAMAKCCQG